MYNSLTKRNYSLPFITFALCAVHGSELGHIFDLTLCRISKLIAHNTCSSVIPSAVADCSPLLILAYFHSSLVLC